MVRCVRGRKPGVYRSWASCSEQVLGFKYCSYKSFKTEEEALSEYRAYCGGRGMFEYERDVPKAVEKKPADTPRSYKCLVYVVLAQLLVILALVYAYAL